MKALTFSTFGGPEVLAYTDVPMPVLQPGQVLLRMRAIGLNYADIYRRKGHYHLKGTPPFIAGYEGAGEVVQTCESAFSVGDRLAFADVPFANAEYVVVPDTHAIPLPEGVSEELAASVLLQGLTAQYLAQDSRQLRASDTVVVHAAAGGVGRLLCQYAKAVGARTIGLSRGIAKFSYILESGADTALDVQGDWVAEVHALTGGQGADVVYDSVGSTLGDSFRATREGGQVVFYGMSGGDPAPVDPRMLMDRSLTLTGGDLWSYLNSPSSRRERADRLFADLQSGVLRPLPVRRFHLSEGAEAHAFLESGQSAGKVLFWL